MKEFYIAPEVQRLGFLPQEELAAGNFDDLLNGGGGTNFATPGSETLVGPGGVSLPLG